MPRLPRVYLEEAIYFITCRGEHAENIFKDERDYQMFLELLKKYQEQYGVKIFAFCLLPDHLHLLVELQKQNEEVSPPATRSQQISGFMRDLNNNYTKYFNGRYERKGHLFRERFKAALVEKEKFLLDMTAYIHLNPEKLNLTPDAKTYPYSSYQLYMFDDAAKREDLQFLNAAIKEALSMLRNQTYAEFVQNVSAEKRAFIHKKLNRGGIVGCEEFIAQVRQEVQAYQEQGLAKKYEVTDKKGYKLFLVFGSLFVILMASAGLFYVFVMHRPEAELPTKNLEIDKTVKTMDATGKAVEGLGNVKTKDWKVKLIPTKGGSASWDILTFDNGTFISEKTNSLGFSNSHYSQTIDDSGAITWKTVQIGPEGEAAWRGEIHDGKMRGILILRQPGQQPQDFSFMSIEEK